MFESLKAKIKTYRPMAILGEATLDQLVLLLVREAKQNGLTISKVNMKEFIVKTLAE